MADASFLRTEVEWRCVALDALSPRELQRIHIARQEVFAVEQVCVFQDADATDELAVHLAGWAPGGALRAYARLVPPGSKYEEASIGRVLTTAVARGSGLGHELVSRAVGECRARFAGKGIRISAQHRLERFYAQAGFKSVGEPYLEDGQPHIEMLLGA